jgi:hypothetical protein
MNTFTLIKLNNMKKLALIIGLGLSLNTFAQTSWTESTQGISPGEYSIYMGVDENGYAIYKNTNFFRSTSAKIGATIIGLFGSAIITHIIVDRRKDKKRQETTQLQENVEV